MSKRKSQVERAIEALEEKKAELGKRYNAEAEALDHAIKALRAQTPKRTPRPRAVAAAANE